MPWFLLPISVLMRADGKMNNYCKLEDASKPSFSSPLSKEKKNDSIGGQIPGTFLTDAGVATPARKNRRKRSTKY